MGACVCIVFRPSPLPRCLVQMPNSPGTTGIRKVGRSVFAAFIYSSASLVVIFQPVEPSLPAPPSFCRPGRSDFSGSQDPVFSGPRPARKAFSVPIPTSIEGCTPYAVTCQYRHEGGSCAGQAVASDGVILDFGSSANISVASGVPGGEANLQEPAVVGGMSYRMTMMILVAFLVA